MNIAMLRLHFTSDAARDFADRHRTLAGHRTEDVDALRAQRLPHLFDRQERDAVALWLAAKGGGKAAFHIIKRRDTDRDNIFHGFLHRSTSFQKSICNCSSLRKA